MCSGGLSALPDPRTHLPSMATVPFNAGTRSPTQRRNTCSKCLGSSMRKSRSKVSAEATPLRRTRKRRNHGSCSCPHSAISATVSQSASMAAIATTSISRTSCRVPLLGRRGSSMSFRHSMRLRGDLARIPSVQKTRVDAVSRRSTRGCIRPLTGNGIPCATTHSASLRCYAFRVRMPWELCGRRDDVARCQVAEILRCNFGVKLQKKPHALPGSCGLNMTSACGAGQALRISSFSTSCTAGTSRSS